MYWYQVQYTLFRYFYQVKLTEYGVFFYNKFKFQTPNIFDSISTIIYASNVITISLIYFIFVLIGTQNAFGVLKRHLSVSATIGLYEKNNIIFFYYRHTIYNIYTRICTYNNNILVSNVLSRIFLRIIPSASCGISSLTYKSNNTHAQVHSCIVHSSRIIMLEQIHKGLQDRFVVILSSQSLE